MIQGIELLKPNHAGAMVLKDGRTVNYGVIRVENDMVVYYTGRGLREMWKPDMTSNEKSTAEDLKKIEKEKDGEEKLITSGHIARTRLDEIERVIF